jgi:predicted negative regulator of RcsB-dependent stress response
MVDRILEFLRNRYFIGSVVAIVLGLIINSFVSYSNERANEVEFKKFQEVNEALALDQELAPNLDELDVDFDSLGYEVITKTILAKKSIDEKDFENALALFAEVYEKVRSSNIPMNSKEVLLDQYSENIVKLHMELGAFENGDLFIKENMINNSRFHDVAGDFYKYFGKDEEANKQYDMALNFDMDQPQKNLINLKRPIK